MIRCPKCAQSHDVTEFEGAQRIQCRCGFNLKISMIASIEDFLRYSESEDERKKAEEIQRDAAMICRMILDDDFSRVDVELAEANLKEKVARLFPDKIKTYEMIYQARFERLWDQFRRR